MRRKGPGWKIFECLDFGVLDSKIWKKVTRFGLRIPRHEASSNILDFTEAHESLKPKTFKNLWLLLLTLKFYIFFTLNPVRPLLKWYFNYKPLAFTPTPRILLQTQVVYSNTYGFYSKPRDFTPNPGSLLQTQVVYSKPRYFTPNPVILPSG